MVEQTNCRFFFNINKSKAQDYYIGKQLTLIQKLLEIEYTMFIKRFFYESSKAIQNVPNFFKFFETNSTEEAVNKVHLSFPPNFRFLL